MVSFDLGCELTVTIGFPVLSSELTTFISIDSPKSVSKMVLQLAHNRHLAEGDLVQIAVTANELRVGMQKECGTWKPGVEEVLFAAFVDYVVSVVSHSLKHV